MAKFKCVHTGTVVEFKTEYDCELMRKHPEYKEVKEEAAKAAPVESLVDLVSDELPEGVVKRGPGRPRKEAQAV